MGEDGSFHDLLTELRDGEDAAAAEVVRRFSTQLIAKASQRIDPAIQPKIDPEDVVQSALGSFFRRYDEGQFELENWDSLWGLLVTITLRKCGRKATHYRAARRDVRREHSFTTSDGYHFDVGAIDRGPTAEDVAVLSELVDELMAKMELESHRNILALSLQGYSPKEVAQSVRRSERTVFRVLDGVKNSLERRMDVGG